MSVTVRWLARLALVAVFLLALGGVGYLGRLFPTSSGQGRTHMFDSFVMGTFLTIKVRDMERGAAKEAASLASEEVERLRAVFDPHDPESELSRINAMAGTGGVVPLGPDMRLVMQSALRLRKLSGRGFESFKKLLELNN